MAFSHANIGGAIEKAYRGGKTHSIHNGQRTTFTRDPATETWKRDLDYRHTNVEPVDPCFDEWLLIQPTRADLTSEDYPSQYDTLSQ